LDDYNLAKSPFEAMNQNQTMTASELGLPDETAVGKLSSDDLFRILSAKIRRGHVICSVAYTIGLIACILFAGIHRDYLVAALSFVWSVAFMTLASLSRRKLSLAKRIATEPRLVFWIHPCHSYIFGYEVILTLHTRTGQSLEVLTSREQARSIVTWLSRQNPDIRLGDFDTTPQK
jgi:hypothetical protein